MTTGTLVKITASKKLMIKISDKSYDQIHARLIAESKRRNFPTERLATFILNDDDNESGEASFMIISLDKYDKQNMRKFEQLLKKEVAVQYRLKPYDFIPDGQSEQIRGINLELINIRQIKPATGMDEIDKMIDARLSQSKELNAEEQAIDEDVEKQVQLLAPPVLERQTGYVRRRRTAAYASQALPSELTGVLAEVKKLEDLIAANEQAIGATE